MTKEEEMSTDKPECFGSGQVRIPQSAAENTCYDCNYLNECMVVSDAIQTSHYGNTKDNPLSKRQQQAAEDLQEVTKCDHINTVLKERGSKYGGFENESAITVKLQTIIHDNGEGLSDSKFHALNMICVKIARICNGDPEYADNWRDIEGYSKLIADELEV